jgi:hypothetical protein
MGRDRPCGEWSGAFVSPDTLGCPMRAEHVLLCYFGSANDHVLGDAAALSRSAGARLSVVLPVVDAPVPDGCCGIQGQQWQRLMDEESRAALEGAVRRLESLDCPVANAAIEVGDSLADVVQRCLTGWGCDVVAVSPKRRPWSTGGLSRHGLEALRDNVTGAVVELRGSAGDVEPRLSLSR